MKQLHLPQLPNLSRRRRALLLVAGVVITSGLVVATVTRVRTERAEAEARPAVCAAVGDLYRAALEGPADAVSDEEWRASIDQSAERLSALHDPFGISADSDRLASSARGRRPSAVRKAAVSVGCPRSIFPPVPSAAFDSTAPDWAQSPVGQDSQPAVVLLPAAQLPPESAVSESVRSASFRTLAEAGVPVDRIPLIDPSQGRIAWVKSSNAQDEYLTVLRFATHLEEPSSAIEYESRGVVGFWGSTVR